MDQVRCSEQGKRSHLSQFNHKQIEVLMAGNDGTGERDDGDDSNDENLQVQLPLKVESYTHLARKSSPKQATRRGPSLPD